MYVHKCKLKLISASPIWPAVRVTLCWHRYIFIADWVDFKCFWFKLVSSWVLIILLSSSDWTDFSKKKKIMDFFQFKKTIYLNTNKCLYMFLFTQKNENRYNRKLLFYYYIRTTINFCSLRIWISFWLTIFFYQIIIVFGLIKKMFSGSGPILCDPLRTSVQVHLKVPYTYNQ